MGTAAAGWSARAQDASTAFTNPAGMTRLEQSQMLAGVQPLYVNVKFDNERATFGGGMAVRPAAGFRLLVSTMYTT